MATYPLHSLEELRQQGVDACARSLVAVRADRERCEVELLHREAELRDWRARLLAQREREAERWARVGGNAQDLAQSAAWERAKLDEERFVEARVAEAMAAVSDAREREAKAEAELLERRRELRAVEMHHESWGREVQRLRERGEEEARDEAFTARSESTP